MCGILGFVGDNTVANRQLIEAIMLQLSLRGTHATGIAWRYQGDINVKCLAVPAEEFFVHPTGMRQLDDTIKMIGHTRYSTSDLAWNQPLLKDGTAMVMNGVLSQEGPETWPKTFGPYETGNDTEIALNAALKGKRGDVHGSFAICELTDSHLLCYRNKYRPLWFGKGDDYELCASTADPLRRCGVPVILPVAVGVLVDLCQPGTFKAIQGSHADDLQRGILTMYDNLKSVV